MDFRVSDSDLVPARCEEHKDKIPGEQLMKGLKTEQAKDLWGKIQEVKSTLRIC